MLGPGPRNKCGVTLSLGRFKLKPSWSGQGKEELAGEQLSYCAGLVRGGDHDRFLSVLFAMERDRENLFALYAFNLEIARIRAQVSEPLLGEIRLQWWREGIEAVYAGGAVRAHPVLQPLAQAIRECDLPRQPFDAIMDAHAAALVPAPPASMAELEKMVDATAGGVARLAARITGGEMDSDSAILHVARAWGLTGLLRNIGFHASQRQIFLPEDAMRVEGVSAESVFGGGNGPELRHIIQAIAAQARRHLDAARSAPGLPSRRLLAAMLPAALTKLYLDRILQPDYDPFHIHPPLPAFLRLTRMAWAMWRRRL